MDCASCAAKIENGISKLEEVDFVSVNFANSSIQIKTTDLEKVKQKINQLEPGVEIVDEQSIKKIKQNSNKLKRELIKIISIVTILVTGIIFLDYLHNTPYHFAEYLVFISIYLVSGWQVLKNAYGR